MLALGLAANRENAVLCLYLSHLQNWHYIQYILYTSIYRPHQAAPVSLVRQFGMGFVDLLHAQKRVIH